MIFYQENYITCILESGEQHVFVAILRTFDN